MKVENKRYIELMIEKCNSAEVIKNQMLQSQYLKQKVSTDAFDKASQVSNIIGILNISVKHKKQLKKMAENTVRQLIKQDISENLDEDSMFFVTK